MKLEHDINESDGMDNVVDDLMQDSQDAIEKGKDAGKNAVEKGKDAVDTIRDIPDKIKDTKDKIDNAKDTVNKVKDKVNDIKNGTKNGTKTAKNGTKSASKGGKAAGQGGKAGGQAASKGGQAAGKAGSKAATEGAKIASKVGQKVAQVASKIAQKVAEVVAKVGSKVAEVVGQALTKLVGLIVKLVCNPYFWLAVLIIVLAIAIAWLIAIIYNECSSSGQKVVSNESADYNETNIGEGGEVIVESYSGTTKVIEAYYQYVAEKSIWVVYEGTVHNNDAIEHDDVMGNVYEPIQYNTPEFNEKFKDENGDIILKDKEKREANFYINPNALFVYDKTLHREQFRFPEQIVQHVQYEGDQETLDNQERFKLKHLTDDETRTLTAESTAYKYVSVDSDEISESFKKSDQFDTYTSIYIPDGENKTIGVWDYGLGSILHYEKYIELHEMRGSYKTFQVWDKNAYFDETTGLYVNGRVRDFSSYEEYEALTDEERGKCDGTTIANKTGDERLITYTEADFPSLASKEVYFIDWVVTPAGDVENNIIYTWVDSMKPWNFQKELEKETFSGTKEVIKVRPRQNPDGSDLSQMIMTYDSSKWGARNVTDTKANCITNTNAIDYYVNILVLPRPVRENENDTIPSANITPTNDKYTGYFQAIKWSTTCNPSKVKDDTTLSCEDDDEDHIHTDSCYVTCGGITETHTAHNDSCWKWSHSGCGVHTYTMYEEYVTTEDVSKEVALEYTEAGTYWDREPQYNGEPDMTNLSGMRYYEDYLTHYDTYIPYNVTGFFDTEEILQRMNIEGDVDDENVQAELDAIIGRSWTNETSNGQGLDSSGGGSASSSQTQEEFIEKVGKYAVEAAKTTGIYPSTVVAQAILESGWGKDDIATSHGNYFGMKVFGTPPYEGHEYWDGNYYATVACEGGDANFRDYTTTGDEEPVYYSIMDHNRNFWVTSTYKEHGVLECVPENLGPQEQLTRIAASGYAVDGDGNITKPDGVRDYGTYLYEEFVVAYDLERFDEQFLAEGGWNGECPFDDGSGYSSSGGGNSDSSKINSIFGWLKGIMASVKEKVQALFGFEDEYYNVFNEQERYEYSIVGAVPENEVIRTMETVFAYTDGVPISDYYNKIDDEFFKTEFTTLFSNPIGKKWNINGTSGTGINQLSIYQAQRDQYYPEGFQRPLENCKIADRESEKGIYYITVKGDNVYAPTNGTITKIGDDEKYGGKYLVIDNGNCRTIIGNINIKDGLDEGSTVKKGDLIGTAAGTELFFGIENSSRVPVDPGFLMYIAGDCESYFPTSGPAQEMPVIPQIQEAYKNYPYGYNTIWGGGCGPSSFAMCLSYITGTFIPTHEVVDTLHYDIHNGNRDGYYLQGAGSYHSIFEQLANHYGINCQDISATESGVKKAIDEGKVVIVSISCSGSSVYRGSGHFITIRGYDETGYWINDSNVGSGAYNCNQTYQWYQLGSVGSARALWKK